MVPSFFSENFYFNIYAVPFFVSALMFFLLGLYVLKQSPKSSLHQSFFGICVPLAIWLASTSFLLVSSHPFWIRFSISGLYFGVSFIPISFYTYSSIWFKRVDKQRPMIILGYLLGVVLNLIIWFTPWIVSGFMKHSWGNYSILTPVGGALYLSGFVLFTVLFFMNLIYGYRQSKDELEKRQVRNVLIGFIIGYAGSVDFLPCYGIEIFPIGAFSTIILVSTIAYTIIRYKLLDIQTVIHKTILWLTTSIIFISPIAVVSYFLHGTLKEVSPIAFAFFVFLYSALCIPYVRIIQPKIDQWFQRKRWNLNQAVSQFTTELVHLKNLEELAQHILYTIYKILYPEDLQLLLWDEVKGNTLVFTREGKVLEISQKHHEDFFKFLSGFDQVLLRDFVEIDPRLENVRETARHFFEETNASVTVPIVLEERLIGTINLARKANLKEYSSAEIKFLSDLRGSAAIAISNSLRLIAMQAQLRKWNEELEKQVNERTKELKEAQAHLIQAEKLATIGTLAGGVAHEINNPLAAILTNAQMLLQDSMNAETKESVELIEEAAVRCREIVQKLMKYSRKSPQEESTEAINLNEVIENTLSFLKYQLEQENIRIALDLKAKTHVRGNANEFAQVFTNLIVNAKDAVHQKGKGASIEICTFETAKEVCAEVEDNGVGIPPEIIAKVFDPFFTTKDVGKGTGLGLSIVQGIVQKYGGKIDIKSKVGAGTKLSVIFQK